MDENIGFMTVQETADNWNIYLFIYLFVDLYCNTKTGRNLAEGK